MIPPPIITTTTATTATASASVAAAGVGVVPNTQDAAASTATSPPHSPCHFDGHALDFDDELHNRRAVLVVLSVNDVHDMLPSHSGRGGIAGLATLLDRERARIPEDATVLVTLNGDFLNGSELGERLQGAHTIELLEHVGIDYVIPGNHEFDFGEAVLRERIAATQRFTWLGSNILDKSTGQRLAGLEDTRLIELNDGLTLGLFGVCTPETPETSNPGDNIVFADFVSTARRCVGELQAQGADFIIAMTHLHIDQDQLLARHVPEINVILGGHDHEPFTMYQGRTLIHKSGQNAFWLARLEFELNKSTKHPERALEIVPQWSMIINQHIPQQHACEAIVVKYLRQMHALANVEDADRVVARVVRPLSTETARARSGECNMCNLVADALRAELKADVGFVNGGFIRGDSFYDVGDVITVGTLDHEMPFPRSAVLVRIRLRTFLDALLEQLARYPAISSTHPHISGLRVIVDRRNHEGKMKITDVTGINGESLDPEIIISVATTEFVAHGGDGCLSWTHGRILATDKRVALVVGRYLTKMETIAYPDREGRITILE